ncbi:MAG: hypothetical protein M3011_11140 [Actinomycetota bacterium]|nr:hypothetical protein [Actinomycetota bacterium]
MAEHARQGKESPEDVPTLLREIATMVVAYVKQETVEPLKGLGRFVAFGAAGIVVAGTGMFLLVLGGLRLLQTETGSAFRGHLKFLPYLFAVIVCGAIAAMALKAGTSPQKDRS